MEVAEEEDAALAEAAAKDLEAMARGWEVTVTVAVAGEARARAEEETARRGTEAAATAEAA